LDNKRQIKKIDGENYVYHCFSFDPKIQEHTFIGNEFIGMEGKGDRNTLEIFDRVVEAGPYGFMPNLVLELQNVFGDGNYVYDGYEIGEDESGIFEFNLIFSSKKNYFSQC